MSTSQNFLQPEKTKVIACATVIEEMLPFIPDHVDYEVLDFGLHLVPGNLKSALQASIDESCHDYDTIILGYGLCSMAVVGLQARDCRLVMPKVDDCIAIYLGSSEAYSEQHKKEPGTYYLTKGWIEVSDTILDDYRRAVEQYGERKADIIMSAMLKNYKRLAYINTGTGNQEKYRTYAKKVADQFDLHFEEIKGSNTLVKRMLHGPWGNEFLVVQPGQKIAYQDFKEMEPNK